MTINTSLISAVVFVATMSGGAAPPASPNPFETQAPLTARNHIDELVFARLKHLDVQPANLCSDTVFVRRAFLDVIGTPAHGG